MKEMIVSSCKSPMSLNLKLVVIVTFLVTQTPASQRSSHKTSNLTANQKASQFTITTCSKEKQKRRKKVHKILDQQHRLDSTCGSTEYLPDINSGVTLGLISGWKPPNAWMARKFLNSGARLAVMAQRAGCTAFNPWHEGLPCSVWKH